MTEPLVPCGICARYAGCEGQPETPTMVPKSKGRCAECASFVKTEGGEICCGPHGRGCPDDATCRVGEKRCPSCQERFKSLHPGR